jgi:nitrous oxidase accessory protein
LIAWVAVALGGEDHAATGPVAVAPVGRTVPPGPSRRLAIAAGEAVQEGVFSLPAGSTLELGPGVHHGPLLIDRPLTLQGSPGAVLDGRGAGSVLLIAAPDVTVRDLRVTGGGRQPQQDDSGVVVAGDRFLVERLVVDNVYLGIDIRSADRGVVRDCVVLGDPAAPFGLRGDGIRLWEAQGNEVFGNELRDVRDMVAWYSDGSFIHDNVVSGSRYGTHLMHSMDTRVERNRYEDDVVGVFVMYAARVSLVENHVLGAHGEAGVGIGLKDSDDLRLIRNVLVDNTTGIYLDTSPQRGEAVFEGNLVAANDVGLRMHGPSGGARFVGNGFVSNRLSAAVDSRGADSGVQFSGNYWSDYAGYDLDADGRGDLPHEVRSLAGALVRREPVLTWFTGTAAWALVDLFGAAFPMFASTVVLVDSDPLIRWEGP